MKKKEIKGIELKKKKKVDEKYNNLNQVIKKNLNERKNNKQPLYEITLKEMKRIRDNNIHLRNYSRKFMEYKCNGIWETHYEIDYVGKNVKQQFNKQRCKSNTNMFQMNQVKNNFLTVTCNINMEMKEDTNIYIIQNGETGIALLLIATIDNTEKQPVVIDDECIKKFKKNRNNLASKTSTTQHFGSMGKVYGVGLVAHYSMDNNLSFGKYSNPRKKKKKVNDKKICADEGYMKQLMEKCMSNAIAALEKKIPNLERTFFSISKLINKELEEYPSQVPSDITGKEIPANLSCQFNVNARTKFSHTERDSSYTIIHVPKQKQEYDTFFFFFKFSKNEELRIEMKQNITISYSSYLLTHSQRTLVNLESSKNEFVNISSYFSKRLFDFISSSLNRIGTNEKINN